MIDEKKTRAAFEKWYSDKWEWPTALQRGRNGGYLYSGAATAWDVWKDATGHAENVVLALLSDVEAALIDLHACDDADCTEPNCLHVLPRIRALLALR